MSDLALKSTHGVFRFSLNDSIKNLESNPIKESLIVLHFSSKKERFKKSIGYKCSLKNWDVTKQRIKTGKGMVVNAYKVNAFINDIQVFSENELSKMLIDLGYIDKNRLSSIVSAKIKGFDFTKEEQESSFLVKYSKKLIESKKNRVGTTTIRAYSQTLRLLTKYEETENITLIFDSIDMAFYRSFVYFLENQGYGVNSIGKHIKTLKIFMNDALTNGITTNVKFKSRNFKVTKETTTDIYLSNEEIDILAKKDFSKRPKIQLARDVFLIGCYTGQRVSDYNGLTTDDIEIIRGHKFIKIRQKKTNSIVHFPITSNIEEVMNRYNNSFPPKMSEPVLRENIKVACSNVGFKDLISISYTKGGKSIKEVLPKYKLVKTHTARRSFCTNHYVAGKPIQNIMLFSGHKTEREFLKYVRIEKEQEALSVFKSGFFD